MKNIKRGDYGEILWSSLTERQKKEVGNLLKEVTSSAKVDEHGGWEFGASFDKKGRGYATNWDIYGVGRDFHSRKLLIIVQVRQWVKKTKNGFANVRKSYFLCGRNEDKTAFAHPVESRVIHHAIKAGPDVVRACQNWIFRYDYRKVLRQGDIAAAPVTRVLSSNPIASPLILEGSHYVTADELRNNGNAVYALNPDIIHLPNTHPRIQVQGWYMITVGKRGRYHNFAVPTID